MQLKSYCFFLTLQKHLTMKRTVNFLIILFSGILIDLYANNHHEIPQHEEQIEKIIVDNIKEGDCGINCIWDCGDISIVNGNYKSILKPLNDSTFCVIENNTSYKYKLNGDSLLWLGFENHLTKNIDEDGVLYMKYPFNYGDSFSDKFCFNGEYSDTQQFVEAGEVILKADAIGTLILPMDTIKNVLRIQRIRKSKAYMGDLATLDLLIEASDTIPLQVETCYQWYSKDCTYPLAEKLKYEYFYNDTLIGCVETSYIYPLSTPSSVSTKQTELTPQLITKGFSANSTPTDNLQNQPEITTGHELWFNYQSNHHNTNVNITICDLHGRVYYSCSVIFPIGKHRKKLSIQSIPPGRYLFIISPKGEASIKQLITID